MAISVTFNGATIYKPGAYSKLDIDLGGGLPLGPAGIVAIAGESLRGKPGKDEQDISRNFFTAEQLPEIRAKYGEGSIVDACNFLFSPASDANIPSGATAIYIYKTNESTQADRALGSDYGLIKSMEYGEGGNRVRFRVEHTKEEAPSVVASTAVDTADIEGKEITVRVNGDAAQSYTAVSADTDPTVLAVNLQAAISGIEVTEDGGILTIKVEEDTDAHERGWGKSLSLSGDLAEYGFAGSQEFTVSSVESAATVTIRQVRDLIEESDTVGGSIVLKVGYTGANATATVSIQSDRVIINSGTAQEFMFSSYPTIAEVAEAIQQESGWRAEVTSTLAGQLSPSILDKVSSLSVKSDANSKLTGRIKRDYDAVRDLFDQSGIADHVEGTRRAGLPDETRNAGGDLIDRSLTGGVVGATNSASIADAFGAFEEIRVNSVVPLFSRDATAEAADGLTDPGSSYQIESIHQLAKTHVNMMSGTAQKSERQAYLSMRGSFVDLQEVAENLADSRVQLSIQDVRQTDSRGRIRWFSPWALSCMLAGARGGSPVGTPLTFKFMNVSGARHTSQPLSTPEEQVNLDFNPRTQFNQAIRSGITFVENPPSGGFRVVVDNTTYGRDANWVLNRGNVRYAADILAFEFRSQMEQIYTGKKNTVRPSEIRSTAETIMGQFLAQGITVSTDDAPNGFKDLVVKLEGNVIRTSLVAKLVEGIDFILNEITVQRATGEA